MCQVHLCAHDGVFIVADFHVIDCKGPIFWPLCLFSEPKRLPWPHSCTWHLYGG